MHAIVNNTNAVIPVNVPNHGNIPELESDDVIEVPCAIGGNGPRALHVGALPAAVRQLTTRVKAYERATVAAAQSMDRASLVGALAQNPLVPSAAVASQLVEELTLR
jgi:6-phospho-beta-glucosidase